MQQFNSTQFVVFEGAGGDEASPPPVCSSVAFIVSSAGVDDTVDVDDTADNDDDSADDDDDDDDDTDDDRSLGSHS